MDCPLGNPLFFMLIILNAQNPVFVYEISLLKWNAGTDCPLSCHSLEGVCEYAFLYCVAAS
ncbi:hypothetical protein SAMN04487851_10839 [Prevotella sp. tc2-28]|nr:hypothetical protein SAMN04487851_10839 [Prevotella sp. tc2-28]